MAQLEHPINKSNSDSGSILLLFFVGDVLFPHACAPLFEMLPASMCCLLHTHGREAARQQHLDRVSPLSQNCASPRFTLTALCLIINSVSLQQP